MYNCVTGENDVKSQC